MNRMLISIALGALVLVLGGCDHSLDDCCTNPATLVNFGPAGAPPQLVACESYVVLAGSGVNCTGTTTVVTGDIGCSPNGNVNGLPSGQPTQGNKHERDTNAAQAQSGCTGAYNDLVVRPSNGTLTGVDLGGRTFSAGVYTFTTTCAINGILTLDAHNNPDAVFVFQVGSSLTCASNSAVVLVNGAKAKNVYWQCGNSATIGNNCSFKGTVIAQQNIACQQGSQVHGRVLARNGTVSLDDCSVTKP
jgi:type VI secretion system secreted protein VgrG